ncbi:MAG TPA: carboxypeptidase-like regulatory domain-containing protein [Thermoanaerobaculia bacterium]|nr:carboxypeptidase-like regulatory domain-containing protein [Thermoanaerobaculia bacterium]
MIFARLGRPLPARAAARLAGLLALAGWSCASAPRPSAAARALEKNPRATIEGRVVDSAGSPVAGVSVYGLPRGKDIPWPLPAVTDSAGRFRLTVFAPAEYGFLLRSEGRTVVTPLPEDPSRLAIPVVPGERREGVELVFLREAWKEAAP